MKLKRIRDWTKQGERKQTKDKNRNIETQMKLLRMRYKIKRAKGQQTNRQHK